MQTKSHIAVLITCFNRVKITITCLEHLYSAIIPLNIRIDIFIVDDNSPDDTGLIIKKKFPEVTIINGSGSLYWSGGMRLAWDTAAKQKKYDFYLWLNDDTLLKKNAFIQLIKDYQWINSDSIISASCNIPDTNVFAYGGKKNGKPVIPNGKPQKCSIINGNFVLVPKKVFELIGTISSDFTHSLGDYDYGLRAQKIGIPCYTSSDYLADCEPNQIPQWRNPNNSFFTRIKQLYSIKGVNLTELIIFHKTHFGSLSIIKVYLSVSLRICFPRLFDRIKILLRK